MSVYVCVDRLGSVWMKTGRGVCVCVCVCVFVGMGLTMEEKKCI